MDEQLPNFIGKSVVFYVSYNTPEWFSDGIVLESPILQKYGNRIFVSGQTPAPVNQNENSWSDNREAALAWDSVIHYIILPSEEYQSTRMLNSVDKEEAINEKQETTKNKNAFKKLLTVFSLSLIGLVIPIVLLIAIVLWIVKML